MLASVDPPEAVVIDVGLAELFPVSEVDSFRSADPAGTLATMAPASRLGLSTWFVGARMLSIWLVSIVVAVFGFPRQWSQKAHTFTSGLCFWVRPGRSFLLPGGHRIVIHGKARGC